MPTNKMIPLTVHYIFVGLFLLSKSENKFLPNLPVGEFRIVFETISSCKSTKNHSIQYNIHFSKRASNLTEILGNITMTTPFNDNQFIDANLASWSSLGGWKENAMVYKNNNACSNVKELFGYAWSSLIKAFNYPTANCPLPTGTYISSGMDVNDLEKNNLPKVFFYGKYKFVLKIKTKDGKLLGCIASQLKIVRPWETPKN